jgi:uncharacterized membrane protein
MYLMRHRALRRTVKIVPLLLLSICTAAFFNIKGVSAQASVVRAVLFFSPRCGHCHKVMTEDLPPLIERFGDQLIIIEINIQTEKGGELFIKAVEYFDIPLRSAGVPFLVVEEVGLMGSAEIPERFPAIVEVGLASGGIDWPQIPGLMNYLLEESLIESAGEGPKETADVLPPQEEGVNENAPNETPQPQDEAYKENQSTTSLNDIENEPITIKQRFLQDVVGNTASVLVLIVMVTVVLWVVMIVTGRWKRKTACPIGVIIFLVVIGIAVSAYMSFVELTHETAVCGPVGDCNTVQQSEYAYLFGIIPVGVLGVVGYGFVFITWSVLRWGPEKMHRTASIILFCMTFGGTLFSIYLTYLEPFVIGASCAWCLTSAIVMTALMWCASQEMILFKKGEQINSP